MGRIITNPTVLQGAGEGHKTIAEFVGRLATQSADVSIALMESAPGWREPGQRPDFDEYTLVLAGEVVVEHETGGSVTVAAQQAFHAPAGEWVRYSTPGAQGARYLSVCVPAFSPDTVNRDGEGDTA